MTLRQTVRSDLRQIVKGGATSRILDLHSIAEAYGGHDDYLARPFFHHPRLNRCFIVKHTVRAHERPYVMSNQPVVTKILIPLAQEDLSLGGHAVFVEEVGFANKIRSEFDCPDDPHLIDLDILRLRELAALPSFDPFLLSERYRNHARPVSDLYFNISESESQRMEHAVASEVISVISLAFGSTQSDRDDIRASNFARQLLSNRDDGRLDALRNSLSMTAMEFKTGIFGWKGILYYRWCMSQTLHALKSFLYELKEVSIVGATPHEQTELEHIRRKIISETRARWASLSGVMKEYEEVFERFCQGQDASGFRTFLLRAPSLFFDIGSDLSVVSHIPGYWRFWANQNKKGYLHAREAMPLFASFISSVTRDNLSGDPAEIMHRSTSNIPRPEVFVPPAA
ncbi:MAG: hypothetical protein QUV02_09250 [Maricaulis sp.]|uniref:hypothetical protein n=1 Tax=Maricaulis sp. TaxID=1486257 RepID=UPI001B0331F4|nr:hypothetical protein [Maricaulis sp.]MBO6728557.1 hypothetical protein [Maricaulis sp.]MBO6846806.1 hypothetical protein [Maricaulis sp.]MBO6877562.1 hypothetical protein [Maricaulis sp.]MDM7984627.1 hypothetical protein [Maricaulis sp.]